MSTAIRIAWVVYGIYQLLLAVGSFPFGSLAALVFWGAAVGTVAFFLARSSMAAYVSAVLTAVGPFVVNAAEPHLFGPVYLTGNLLVAILMAWLALVLGRRRALDRF